jgi:hypothetical protein
MAMHIELAEKALLLAARDQLRSVGGYKEHECDIELDDMAPAIVGETYVLVTTGGITPGKYQNTAGTVADLLYAVDVTVVKRAKHVPRDRQRNVFLDNLSGFDAEFAKVFSALDWSYAVNAAANELLLQEAAVEERFVEPLRFASMDRKPRPANPDFFAASGNQAAGLMRTISFGGARRITIK